MHEVAARVRQAMIIAPILSIVQAMRINMSYVLNDYVAEYAEEHSVQIGYSYVEDGDEVWFFHPETTDMADVNHFDVHQMRNEQTNWASIVFVLLAYMKTTDNLNDKFKELTYARKLAAYNEEKAKYEASMEVEEEPAEDAFEEEQFF